uniref:Secretory immunoglobulin A-binding protein EsiB n=1 Tax=Anas zonorhyncha TaxID=75864 RepID=A0A8B9ZV75_9AVES
MVTFSTIPLISAKQLGCDHHKSGAKLGEGDHGDLRRGRQLSELQQRGAMGDTEPPARRRWVGRGSAGSREENPSLQGGEHPSVVWSTWELVAVAAAALLLLYMALCYQGFHFHVAQVYARLGYPHAQHIVGQRYLQGAGVEKSEDLAMHWFRQAAGQGHPHSSFNLALGALRNMTAALEEGEVEKLLSVAAAHGLQEAQELLENILKSRNLP